MTKRITSLLVLCTALTIGGCYKNDPLKEKERALEAKKKRTEQTDPEDNTVNSNSSDDKKPEEGGNSGSGDKKPEEGGNSGSGDKKPEEGSTNGSGDKKPEEGGTNGSDDKKPEEGGTNGSDDKKPEKEPEQPKEEFITTLYDFSHWATVPRKKHTIPLLTANEDPAKSFWAAASNYGYDMATIFGAPVKGYPVEALPNGYKGQGVRLRTIKTTFALVAGALYSGRVNEAGILSRNPTLFGQDCTNEPIELSFYYQYKAGQDKVKGLPNERDQASVQGVLYEVTKNNAHLDGKTIKNDPRIVSRTYMMLTDTQPGVWTEQSLKFAPVSEATGKSIDFKTKKYRLAIIFSSSAKGDELTGAHLSELLIDELTLKSKK